MTTAAPGQTVRAIMVGTEPWFVAKDVCEAPCFGTNKTGTGKYLAGLDADEVNSVRDPSGIRRGNPNLMIINESQWILCQRRKAPQSPCNASEQFHVGYRLTIAAAS